MLTFFQIELIEKNEKFKTENEFLRSKLIGLLNENSDGYLSASIKSGSDEALSQEASKDKNVLLESETNNSTSKIDQILMIAYNKMN